jgi:hypothetical protein
MILLSWNYRWLGNPRTIQALHQLVKEKRPSIVVREVSQEENKRHFYLPWKSAKSNGYNRIKLDGGRGGTEH